MDIYFSTFNCHINNAKKRAIKKFKKKFGKTVFQKEIKPYLEKGIMSIFQENPNYYTEWFVKKIAKYVNDNPDGSNYNLDSFKMQPIGF